MVGAWRSVERWANSCICWCSYSEDSEHFAYLDEMLDIDHLIAGDRDFSVSLDEEEMAEYEQYMEEYEEDGNTHSL